MVNSHKKGREDECKRDGEIGERLILSHFLREDMARAQQSLVGVAHGTDRLVIHCQ
jgi:hypothetical protein